MATTYFKDISVKGKPVRVPAADIAGRTIIVTGSVLRVARIFDAEFTGTESVDSEALIAGFRASGLRADLLTFAGDIDERQPRLSYRYDWDNVAAAASADHDAWWESLPQTSRKNCRRAAKRGVTLDVVRLDDALVAGIKRLYDESPLRQGRHFWHYGKSLERVREDNSTYLERAEFIGAYFEGELIGFMKIVYVGTTARIMQILAAAAHQDKRPMNALLAKAMEVCHAQGMRFLVYSKFSFGNKKPDDMAEFKLRQGFVQLDFPNYFVPLTARGRLGFSLGLHRGILGILPSGVIDTLSKARRRVLATLHGQASSVVPAAGSAEPTTSATTGS